MPIPNKPRGSGPLGSTNAHHTRHYQSFMEDMEDSFPDWQRDAECSRLPPEQFEYEGAASKPLLEEGIKACKSCLVKDKCLEQADDSDRYWTVRGGLLPGVFHMTTQAKPGRPSKNTPDIQPDMACHRGHVDRWSRDTKGYWRCKECERLREYIRRNGGEMPPILAKPDTCPKGHGDDFFRDKRGYRECRECKRIRDRARHARERAAKIDV